MLDEKYVDEFSLRETLQQELRRVEKENEQLKQQEKRLYKYFRKCFDNITERSFKETWEIVKKYD